MPLSCTSINLDYMVGDLGGGGERGNNTFSLCACTMSYITGPRPQLYCLGGCCKTSSM